MRITETAKFATRERIIACAAQLFATKGFEQTTTREITEAAQIATGTLFNYFPAKEDIAVNLVAQEMDKAREEFVRRRGVNAPLEEDLFAHIATGLRHLHQYRNLIQPVLETVLTPFSKVAPGDVADAMRRKHLETVEALVMEHGVGAQFSVPAMHLYWTLYSGILRYFAADNSRNNEDTLAMLDQWIQLFATSLTQTKTSTSQEAHNDD